jgi:hypothetical protein
VDEWFIQLLTDHKNAPRVACMNQLLACSAVLLGTAGCATRTVELRGDEFANQVRKGSSHEYSVRSTKEGLSRMGPNSWVHFQTENGWTEGVQGSDLSIGSRGVYRSAPNKKKYVVGTPGAPEHVFDSEAARTRWVAERNAEHSDAEPCVSWEQSAAEDSRSIAEGSAVTDAEVDSAIDACQKRVYRVHHPGASFEDREVHEELAWDKIRAVRVENEDGAKSLAYGGATLGVSLLLAPVVLGGAALSAGTQGGLSGSSGGTTVKGLGSLPSPGVPLGQPERTTATNAGFTEHEDDIAATTPLFDAKARRRGIVQVVPQSDISFATSRSLYATSLAVSARWLGLFDTGVGGKLVFAPTRASERNYATPFLRLGAQFDLDARRRVSIPIAIEFWPGHFRGDYALEWHPSRATSIGAYAFQPTWFGDSKWSAMHGARFGMRL